MPVADTARDFVLSLRHTPDGGPCGTLRVVGQQHETAFEGWIALLGLIDHASLCDGWRIRDLVSHMVLGHTTPVPTMVVLIARTAAPRTWTLAGTLGGASARTTGMVETRSHTGQEELSCRK